MQRSAAVISAIIIVIGALAAETGRAAEAYVDDGFRAARRMESRYFDIHVEPGVDLEGLAMKLSVPASIKAIIRRPADFTDSYTLRDQLDTFYLAVLEIMDMKLTRFKCTLKICADGGRLSEIATRLYGSAVEPASFYVSAIDTLYIDAENVTLYILGHELSHAVQADYFLVPPPEKLQEILSGYVEFQLRKYTNTLP